MNGRQTSDVLIVAVDFSPTDDDLLMVTREKNGNAEIIKVLTNEEAVEVYDKLTKQKLCGVVTKQLRSRKEQYDRAGSN